MLGVKKSIHGHCPKALSGLIDIIQVAIVERLRLAAETQNNETKEIFKSVIQDNVVVIMSQRLLLFCCPVFCFHRQSAQCPSVEPESVTGN